MNLQRFIFFFLFTMLCILSGCNQAKLSDARKKYVRGEFYGAAETYRKVYRKMKKEERIKRGIVAYEMAGCYRRLNMPARAATAYSNAIRYDYPDTVMWLDYARVLQQLGRYDNAEKAYRNYIALAGVNYLALTGLEGVELSRWWKENPTRYKVHPMDVFNSRRAEFSPILTPDADIIYFSSSRNEGEEEVKSSITGLNNNDFFTSKKNEKGEWQRPKRIESDINTELDEGAGSITADGSKLYYTYCPEDKNHPRTSQIYVSSRSSAEWGKGELLEIANDTVSIFAHPAIAPSGEYLYFVSDMPGGFGGKDIWRAELGMDQKVLFIDNMGPDINTPGDELFPYIRNDSTFYFSSNGHAGMGGLDLFEVTKKRNGDGWQVHNMQYPMNSEGDDFGITFEKKKERGFFSSNRGDARGRDHIFSFEYPDVNVIVEGFTVNKDDEFIPGAMVTIIGEDGSQQRLTTKQDGTYRFRAERGTSYVFLASAKGYLNQKQILSTSPIEKDTLYYVDFEMSSYTRPEILENIFYDFDKATLRPESKEELDELIKLLNDNPHISIELSAHADRKGSDEYNKNLSLRRAQSVVQYLITNGIDERRLTAAGYGKTRPKIVTVAIGKQYDFLSEGTELTEKFIFTLSPEKQKIADQINRRTEFEVTDMNFGLY